MKGSLKSQVGADGKPTNKWIIRIDTGAGVGGARSKTPGHLIRKQKIIRFRGNERDAQKKLRALLTSVDSGAFVEPSKLTLGEWLVEWLDASQKPRIRHSSYVRYKGILDSNLLKAPITGVPLQKLRPSHLEQYYATARATLSASTLTLHHAILHKALRRAERDGLVLKNVAGNLEGKPRRSHNREDAREHCWTVTEARAFLMTAKAAGPQPAAFYSLALDTGARKGELCGLQWADVDLDTGKIRIVQQLLSPTVKEDGTLDVGPTKTGKPRTVSLAPETVALLRTHRKHQRELMMANRTIYHDHGLVFAKQWSDVRRRGEYVGQPLQMNNLGQREYATLIKAADVKRIKFHGLRHTCATLLLQAGQPIHVVSERLGHSKITMTLDAYAHVLPDMQQDAATKLGALLHG